MTPAPQNSPSASLNRPQAWAWGLCLLGLFALPQTFSVALQDQFELPKQLLLRALLCLVYGLCLAQWLGAQEPRWRRSSLDWPVLAWCAWALACTALSVSPALSWRGEYENFAGSLTTLCYGALFFAVLQLARDAKAARRLLSALLSAGLGAALYALLQSLQQDLVQWSASTVIQDRFFGPLGNPNFLGGLLCMLLPLKLALALEEQDGPQDPDRYGRWAALGLWAGCYLLAGKAKELLPLATRPGASLSSSSILILWLCSLVLAPLCRRWGRPKAAHWLAQGADMALYFQALANTGTRGAMLGLLAGLALLWSGRALLARQAGADKGLPWRRAGLGLGLGALALALAFAGLSPAFRQRMAGSLRSPGEALERSRLQIWRPALQIWKDRPLAGSGVDSFKTVFPQYNSSRFNLYDGENVSSRNAHSEPLQVLATQGAVGLALWLWLLGAAGLLWARALRAAQDRAARARLLGLGAFSAAYLGQNLVSFGVAGISAPFWAGLGLLAAAGPVREAALPRAGWKPLAAWGLAGGLALFGLRLDYQTLAADQGYSRASLLQAQSQGLEQASLEEARNLAHAAAAEFGYSGVTLSGELKVEQGLWTGALAGMDAELGRRAGQAPELRLGYQRCAASLMLVLAAANLEASVARCPGEVKYWVFLGLCYEDLLRWSVPERQGLWFKTALQAYERASKMNPNNAYYHGNQGRLLSLAAGNGGTAAWQGAEAAYLAAISLAPSTRLFYENLLLLYARSAKVAEAQALLEKVRSHDPELAPSLLIASASTFYEALLKAEGPWNKAAQAQARTAAVDWARQALGLKPDAEYALLLAMFEEGAGHRAQARQAVEEALRLKPDFQEALRFKKDKEL